MSTARFTSRLTVWTTDETADAYERQAARGLLSTSALLRMAVDDFARRNGLLAPQNNHQYPAE